MSHEEAVTHQLIAIMTGHATGPGTVAAWNFIAEAVKIHLAPAGAA